MSIALLASAGKGAAPKLYPEDVFSTYLYTPINSWDTTVNNGIDLAGKGGLVWIKDRSNSSHFLVDTLRGGTNPLDTASTSGQADSAPNGIVPFLSNGFYLKGTNSSFNSTGRSYASWTFRNADKFFKTTTKVHTNGTTSTVDLSTLGEVGMVTVKATSTTSNWFTWHRGLTAGNNLKLNLTDAQSATNAYLSVSGTTLTIASTAPSDTYIIYAWAHDTSADGIIQCGSFTTDASGNATVNLGWEPQYVLRKKTTSTDNWEIIDSMRGMPVGGDENQLQANLSAAETGSGNRVTPNATGFTAALSISSTYIYLAIRRPNKVPTSGTEVFAIDQGDSSATNPQFISGFPVDFAIEKTKTGSDSWVATRLAGRTYLKINTSATEGIADVFNTSFNNGWYSTFSSTNDYSWMFKRAKGFMTITAHTDLTSSDVIAHDLGVIPEMIWAKCRSTAEDWFIYHKDLTSGYTLKFTTAAEASDASRFTSLSATQFTYGGGTAARTRIFYSFATLAGISKVFTFTADISKTINCGFTTGARFIMLKKKNGTGSFYIWDSVRGIVSGNDPYLLLDSTAAEVTSTDLIDPEASGFISNFTDGGVYVGYAIS